MASSNIAQKCRQEMTSRPGFMARKALILLIGSMVFSAHSADVHPTSVEKLISESLGQPTNRVSVEADGYDKRMEGCETPRAFLPYPVNPNGGRTTVGFRCDDGLPARYLPVSVKVTGSYWVPAEDIPRGAVVTQAMIVEKIGDLSKLPRNIILEGQPIVGLQTNRFLKANSPVQRTSLEAVFVVKRNSQVDVQALGPGFTIRREGVALDNGAMGASIRVKINGGDTVRARVAGANLLQIDI